MRQTFIIVFKYLTNASNILKVRAIYVAPYLCALSLCLILCTLSLRLEFLGRGDAQGMTYADCQPLASEAPAGWLASHFWKQTSPRARLRTAPCGREGALSEWMNANRLRLRRRQHYQHRQHLPLLQDRCYVLSHVLCSVCFVWGAGGMCRTSPRRPPGPPAIISITTILLIA